MPAGTRAHRTHSGQKATWAESSHRALQGLGSAPRTSPGLAGLSRGQRRVGGTGKTTGIVAAALPFLSPLVGGDPLLLLLLLPPRKWQRGPRSVGERPARRHLEAGGTAAAEPLLPGLLPEVASGGPRAATPPLPGLARSPRAPDGAGPAVRPPHRAGREPGGRAPRARAPGKPPRDGRYRRPRPFRGARPRRRPRLPPSARRSLPLAPALLL